jgi:hypothetical protein
VISCRSLLLLCGLVLATATRLASASGDVADEDAGKPLWELRLAAFGRYGASYPASEESQTNIVPLPVPIYRGRFLRLFEDQEKPFRGRLFRRDRVKLDLDLDIKFPVDSEDVDARTGMPDLDLLLEAGPELEFEFAGQRDQAGAWFLGLQLRAAASFDGLSPDYRGLSFSPELKYIWEFTETDEFRFRITPTFATEKYMAYYYDVAPEFARPGRPAYQADAGYLGTDFTLNWQRSFSDRLDFFIGLRASWHDGASNDDSPLFTEDLTTAVYGAVLYRLWASKRTAKGPRSGEAATARLVPASNPFNLP